MKVKSGAGGGAGYATFIKYWFENIIWPGTVGKLRAAGKT